MYPEGDEVDNYLVTLFINYLSSRGWDLAIDVCPWDGEESEYMFANGDATDFVDDFLEKYPKYCREAIEEIAIEVGELSDMFRDGCEPDTDNGPSPEEEDHLEEEQHYQPELE